MNREERLEQLLTATVKLLDRWEEYSLETNCGEPEGYGAARAVVHAEFSVLKQTDKGDGENGEAHQQQLFLLQHRLFSIRCFRVCPRTAIK